MGDTFIPLAFKDDAYRAVIAGELPDQWFDDLDAAAFWAISEDSSSLDVTAQFFPPVAATGDELQAAQDYNEDYQWTLLDEEWSANVYGFPDQALDVAAALFPPAAAEPIETFAAQPHFGEWLWDIEAPEDFQTYIVRDTHVPPLSPNETYNNTFEGGTDTIAVTVGNSGGASGDAFARTDGTVTFSDNQPIVGTLAGEIFSGTSGTAARVGFDFTRPMTQAFARAYFYLSGLYTSGAFRILNFYGPGAGADQPIIGVDSGGHLILVDANGSTLATSTTVLPQEQDFRIEARVTWAGVTLGSLTARIFVTNPDSTTPDETVGPVATPNIQAGAIGGAYFGFAHLTGTTVPIGLYIDNVGLSTLDWMGPLGTVRTPSARPSLQATPLGEQPWFPDQDIDTELQNDSTLEVIAQLFPPDVTEPFFAQQLAEQPWFADQETENYDDSSTLDVTPQFFPPSAAEPIETFAAQPHFGEWVWDSDQTEDYHQPPEQNEAIIAGAPVVLVFDTFNRADSSTTLGTADSGQVWQALSGTWGITSNQGDSVTGGSQEIAVVDAGAADIDMSLDIVLAATADNGFVFRVADDNNYLVIVVATTTLGLWKRQGGGFTNLTSSAVFSSIANGTHRFRLTAVGALITAYVDGVQQIVFTLSGADQTSYGTNTKLGLRNNDASATRWDNLNVLGPFDVFGAATYPLPEQAWFPEPETEDYSPFLEQNEGFIAGPPAGADDSYIATLDLPDQVDFTEPDWDANPLPEQLEGFLSPNDAFDVTIATQYPLSEQPWFPDQDIDTELANDSTLETVAQFTPPDVTGDFFATQPLAEQPWFPEQDTEDYFNDSTVDTSWAMDFASGDETTIATEPLSEQPWFPEQETEDYDDSSTLDVTPAFFPPAIAGDDLLAAQLDLSVGQDPGLNPEWDYTNDQPLVDGAVEAFQSPNDAFDTTIATQPLAEQPWFEAQDIDTELANDSTLEDVAPLFPPDVSFLAVVDVLPDPQWPTEDEGFDWYSALDDHAVEVPAPSVAEEFFAQYPLAEQPWFPGQETEDFAYDSTLDTTAQLFPPAVVAVAELAAQYPLAEQPWFPDQETEEFSYLSTLDTVGQFFPPPIAAVAEIIGSFDPSVGQDWLLWPAPDPTNDQPLVDGAPEAIGAGTLSEDQEGIWQKQNRYHVNKGHWDDVSQGRILRWPP